jgi:hypothetical protein
MNELMNDGRTDLVVIQSYGFILYWYEKLIQIFIVTSKTFFSFHFSFSIKENPEPFDHIFDVFFLCDHGG